MTQLRLQRRTSNGGNPSSPTSELKVGDTSRKGHDEHEDISPNKKSLLTKMRMKAKKLQHSLSNKKKHSEEEEENRTPSWGVRLEDYEDADADDEGDPEYLGAPMYESEMAPEELKVIARQHPRADLAISERRYCLCMHARRGSGQETEKSNSNESATGPVTETPQNDNSASPSKKLRDVMTEKLAPAYSFVSNATDAFTSKIQCLTISPGAALEPLNRASTGTTNECHRVEAAGTGVSEIKFADSTSQIRDKGVSMREYIMQKFEPGEDERALYQVISEAVSPRPHPRKNGSNGGVVERMKGTVCSFWCNEAKESMLSSSCRDAYEAGEETHGRVLQAN